MTTEQLLKAWSVWVDHHKKTDAEYLDKPITWLDFGVFIRWIQKGEEAQMAEFEKDPSAAIMNMLAKK